MSMLRFNDSISFDTSGPLRIVYKSEGMYVVGEGMMVPVREQGEGLQLIENILKSRGEIVRETELT